MTSVAAALSTAVLSTAALPPALLRTGVLLPESTLHTDAFKVLATFVALNTLMYVTLAVLKVLPKGYAFSWFRGRNRRAQNRSIYPEPPSRRTPSAEG